MALTYDQVSGLTHALINESSADNIYDSNPLFMHLKEKGQVVLDGGIHYQMPITYAKIGAAGTFKKYSLLDTTPTDSETAAKWAWKYNYAHVIVSKTELLENSGKSQAVNLLKVKTENAMAALRDNLGTQIFSTNGDSDEGMNGLRGTVDSTGTAGGISQSDFAGWASDEDSSTTALALSTMEGNFLDVSIGSDEPDIIVTTKPIFKKYWSLLQANQRFAATEVGKGGFRYLMFNFVPIFHDSHCPSKHMFYLNSRWLYLAVHKDANMVTEKIGPSPVQAVHIDRVIFGGNLCTDNRRMHHKSTLLNYT